MGKGLFTSQLVIIVLPPSQVTDWSLVGELLEALT